MSSKKRIGVFSGTRAEYGLLVPLLQALQGSEDFEIALIVSGSHTLSNYGDTQDEITRDGFAIACKVPIAMDGVDLHMTASTIGSLIVSFVPEFAKLNLDLLLVYGDRFETLAATVAASQMGIPVGHIEAGDRTEGGSLDDSVRHAITKLSHLFFTSNAEASARVAQLGEEPWRIHTVGLLSNDFILSQQYATVEELMQTLKLDPACPLILFTQHSVATQFDEAKTQIRSSLEALAEFVGRGVQLVITSANNDAGGDQINRALGEFQQKYPKAVSYHPSVGRHNYHGLLHWCVSSETKGGACVGNSSSGIKEAAAFGCPVVNIGTRQLSRLAPANVIHVEQESKQISVAIERALFDPSFRASAGCCENPYGGQGASRTILEIIARYDAPRLLKKAFIDRF